MASKEKLENLLSDIQNLETLVKGLMLEDDLPAQSLSRTCNLAYSVVEKLKAIENEQLQQLNIRLVEQQEELNHLSVLLEQYKAMAETCKKNIQAAKQGSLQEEIPVVHVEQIVSPSVPKQNISLHDVLEKKSLSDFRKAFSLNDRFRFRRELFHGDEKAMNKVISALNDIDSLQESLEYVKSTLHWNMDEETVKDFVGLLDKRFI